MIEKHNYRRQVCPYCRSARLDKVNIVRESEAAALNGRTDRNEAQKRIYLWDRQCRNCKRAFHQNNIKTMYDRAAMRRDYHRLGKLLGKRATQ